MSKTLRNLSFMVLVALMLGAATTGCGKKPDTTPSELKTGDAPTTPNTSSTGSDMERLQGVWAIESMEEDSDGKKGRPEDEKMKDEMIKGMRFQFKGNKSSMLIGELRQDATFELDEKANPKVMIATELDDKGEPKKKLGKDFKPTSEPKIDESIYKFEGDLLVIAHSEGLNAARPTEFKARAYKPKTGAQPEVSAVFVFKLKKTNEPFKDMAPSKPKNPGPGPSIRPGATFK